VTTSLFSTYRQGENRVTATLLAVLERLSLSNIDKFLQGVLSDSATRLVAFENQPPGDVSRPDAVIRAFRSLWIETKTTAGSLREDQLTHHLKVVKEQDVLLLITPDVVPPTFINRFPNVRWINFASIRDVVNKAILDDRSDPPTERESFLLRELLNMLANDGLLEDPSDLVLVVAASSAWPIYQKLSAYICQEGRSFQPATHLAFYSSGEIHPYVPMIINSVDSFVFNDSGLAELEGELQGMAAELLNLVRNSEPEYLDATHKVLFLTSLTDPRTHRLANPVRHSGHAFTYGHRYVSFKKLQTNPIKTSELVS
jgi:hypothetical protein